MAAPGRELLRQAEGVQTHRNAQRQNRHKLRSHGHARSSDHQLTITESQQALVGTVKSPWFADNWIPVTHGAETLRGPSLSSCHAPVRTHPDPSDRLPGTA